MAQDYAVPRGSVRGENEEANARSWFAQQDRLRTQPVGQPVRLNDNGTTGPQPTAPTQPAVTTPPRPQTSGGGDPLALIEQWQHELPVGQQSLGTIVARLNQAGIPAVLATHMGGTQQSGDAIVLPDGRVLDLIGGWDGPNPTWTLNHTDNYDPSRAIVGANGEFVAFGDYLQSLGLPVPTARPFAHGGAGGAAAGGGGGNAGSIADLVKGDPSYEFRLKEGQKALERSAAARGTLLTGGTAKALERYGQDYASTEYGKMFDRNYQLATLGYNAASRAGQFGADYANNFGTASTSYANGVGLNARTLGNQTGENGRNFGLLQDNALFGQGNVLGNAKIGSANAWRGSIADIANALGEYMARRNQPKPSTPPPSTPPYGG